MSHRPSRSRSTRIATAQPSFARSNSGFGLVERSRRTSSPASPRPAGLVVGLLEQRVHDVLDLGPRSRCAAPPGWTGCCRGTPASSRAAARVEERVGLGHRAQRRHRAAGRGRDRLALGAERELEVTPTPRPGARRPRSCSRRRSAGCVAGCLCTGSGATSHSKSVIVRNVGTTLRDSIIIASAPSRNRVSKSRGLGLLVGRRHAVARPAGRGTPGSAGSRAGCRSRSRSALRGRRRPRRRWTR